MKTMKIVAIALLFIASPVFAYVEPVLCGTQGNCQYKTPTILSKDVIDLQGQIDQLVRKNIELEARLNREQAPAQITAPQGPQTSVNDAGQTTRIENLEHRVGVLEGMMNALKTALNKTLDLLTKILKLL